MFSNFLYHKRWEFRHTHVKRILSDKCQKSIMVELGVVFQQTLKDLVGLLVVDHVRQFGHDLLDQRVNDVDGECLHAHVQHPAPLYVLCK